MNRHPVWIGNFKKNAPHGWFQRCDPQSWLMLVAWSPCEQSPLFDHVWVSSRLHVGTGIVHWLDSPESSHQRGICAFNMIQRPEICMVFFAQGNFNRFTLSVLMAPFNPNWLSWDFFAGDPSIYIHLSMLRSMQKRPWLFWAKKNLWRKTIP